MVIGILNRVDLAWVFLLLTMITGPAFAFAQLQTKSAALGSTPVLPQLNVKDFGAKADGATDDTAAINAAMRTIKNTGGGTLFFPRGIYRITSTLDFGTRGNVVPVVHVIGEGIRPGSESLGTVIKGDFAGDLVKFNTTSVLIRGIHFVMGPLGMSAIRIEGSVNAVVEWIQITSRGAYGLFAYDNFSLNIRNIKLNGNHNAGIGLYTSGHVLIEASDITGWNEGIRASGATANIIGSRLEVNKTALRLGVNEAGSNVALSRSLISGNSLEANDIGIELNSVNNTVLSGMGMQGSSNAPSGMSKIGLLVGSVNDVVFSGMTINGSFSDAAIRIKPSGETRQSWFNVSAGNDIATAKVWDVQAGLENITFHGTNYTIRPDDTIKTQYLQRQGSFQYLSQIDYLNPNVEGKNLRGKNISVPTAATNMDIAFTSQHSVGAAAINTATAEFGGSLAADTYYYLATAVTSHGETSGTGEKGVVVSAPNNAVAITFSGMKQDGFKRRIYRGTRPGVYDGYFETALNSNATFTDNGGPFSGRRSPPAAGIDETSMIEPDANYAVLVTPSWNTTHWVTGKATTGFTINFGRPAPRTGGTIDYFIVR